MPIQVMSSIELEDERIIDLGTSPYLTVDTEEKKEEKGQEVATVKL